MTFANRNRGGTHVYARSLFSALRDREGVTAWVVAGPRASGIAGTMNWLVRGARRELHIKSPDILHCPSFVAPWGTHVPFIVTVHDAAARRFPKDHPLEWRLYDRRIMPSRLRAAARVIAVSEFARQEVIEVYGLDPKRVIAVHNGIDSRFFAQLNLDATRNGPLLFPGAPLGRKNLDVVLRSMAHAGASSALARAQLHISGATAAEFPGYARMISGLGLDARVHWLGYVADMPARIRSAAAVVYPSLYEGFGFPALEAMALGTPVVASNRGSLPEVLGDAALTPDPQDEKAVTDAIEAVLTDAALRDRLHREGIARARMFTWEACAEKTVDVYRDALAEQRVAV
jgi:glycosyltransferase involved in cell wall biosynthesis